MVGWHHGQIRMNVYEKKVMKMQSPQQAGDYQEETQMKPAPLLMSIQPTPTLRGT